MRKSLLLLAAAILLACEPADVGYEVSVTQGQLDYKLDPLIPAPRKHKDKLERLMREAGYEAKFEIKTLHVQMSVKLPPGRGIVPAITEIEHILETAFGLPFTRFGNIQGLRQKVSLAELRKENPQ